jgi:endonuclease/exonuclease/phosphatase (EEP) superfamily protein YafD
VRRLDQTLSWLLGGVALASACALFAPLGWPFELFAHFRAQYLVAALLLAALLAWRRLATPAVLALVLVGWHAWPAAQGLVAAPSTADCSGPTLTVATANVRYSNEDHARFLAWLDTEPADLVVVQEVTAAWARDLAARRGYPYQHVLTREDPYGIAILSRWPLEAVSLVDLAGDELPSLGAVVAVDGRRIQVYGLHTHWPVTPSLARARDEALQAAAALARDGTLPVVLLGDLNLTSYSPPFDRLLGEGRLRDAMQGQGWRPTWQAGFWPLALRIDHVLVSPGLCVEDATVGPAVGSDHRPVLARLRL